MLYIGVMYQRGAMMSPTARLEKLKQQKLLQQQKLKQRAGTGTSMISNFDWFKVPYIF